MNESEGFLKDLEGNQEDAFSHLNKTTDDESEKDESDEVIEEGRFKGNRYTRREASKAQKYKEEAIALNAKLQAITESRTESDSEEAEYLKKAAKIYGDAGEDGKFDPKRAEATKLLKEAMQDLETSAIEKAYKRLDEERNGETDAVKTEEDNIESDIESVEDEFGVDLSEGTKREGFLNLYEKLSRKDSNGNIIEFPDPIVTYELYQSRTQKSSSKAQDLSSRSMTRGGSSSGSKLQETAVDNYAKDRGWN